MTSEVMDTVLPPSDTDFRIEQISRMEDTEHAAHNKHRRYGADFLDGVYSLASSG